MGGVDGCWDEDSGGVGLCGGKGGAAGKESGVFAGDDGVGVWGGCEEEAEGAVADGEECTMGSLGGWSIAYLLAMAVRTFKLEDLTSHLQLWEDRWSNFNRPRVVA